MQKLFSSSWKVLLVLSGFSLVMRFFSFYPSVIDHDESTYIIIADALRRGQVYLRDIFDTKPIGIFVLFAIFQTFFGKTIIAIRFITAIWIGITGWMIFKTHHLFLENNAKTIFNPAPLASGTIYVFMTSMFTLYGLSPNTELFFNLFTITSLYIILRHKGIGWYFLAGLLLGLGFIIKYVVLFDAIALGLFFIWQQVLAKKSWSYWLMRCVVMGAAFLIPFLVIWGYYRSLGLNDTFLFYSFELSGRYMIKNGWHDYLSYILNSFRSFLPVLIFFIYCLFHWRTTGPALPFLALLWGVLDLIVILLPGKFFPHYFIQLMVPLSLLAGSFFDPRRSPGKMLSWIRKPTIGYPLMVLIVVLSMIFHKKIFYDKKDYPREVAAYLNQRLQPGDVLYTGDYHHIIYLLTGTHSPTPYLHSSLLWLPENSKALNINADDEMNKILLQKPRFILIRWPLHQNNPLYETLITSYHVVKTFDWEVMVYERIDL